MEKNVPEIRFEGFSGEWITTDIAELALFNPKEELPECFKYVDLESVKGTSLIGYRVELRENAPSRAQRLAKKGDVFFQTVRPYQKNNYLFDKLENDYVFSTGYAQLRPYYDGHFLLNLIQRDSFVKNVLDNCTGTSYPAINSSVLAGLEVSYPETKDEQTKIGNTFQKLDSLIKQHQQKHDKLSSIKKAMLERMFPKQGETIPEIRFKGFSGEWEESNLAECTDLLTGNPFNSKEFTTEGILLIRGMNVKRGYLDTSSKISEYWPSSKGLERYLLEPEDIVIQMDGALIGKSYAKINSNNLPAILVQRVTRVRCSKVDPEFMYQYIQRDFLNHISGIKTETAVPHLSLHDIRNFSVFLPERTEQTKIGNYFQKLDALINQHQQQIAKLNNIKQACLSKMFV